MTDIVFLLELSNYVDEMEELLIVPPKNT